MWDNQYQKKDPGQEHALVVKRLKPGLRQVSLRWLIGTILTGLASYILMAIALFTALEGQQQLITPLQWFNVDADIPDFDRNKSDRIAPTRVRQSFDSKRQFELSILQNKGDAKIIETQKFEWIRMALAEERPYQYTYPQFDALSMFTRDWEKQTPTSQGSGQIYGAKTQTKMTLRSRNFIVNEINFDGTDTFTDDKAQQEIQNAGLVVDTKNEFLSILTLGELLKTDNLLSTLKLSDNPEVRITQENLTISPQKNRIDLTKNYVEDIIPVHKKQTILKILQEFESDYNTEQIEQVAQALATLNHSDFLKEESLLRLGIVTQHGEEDHIVRASIYRKKYHVLTVALNDDNQFVESIEPEMSPILQTAFQNGLSHSAINVGRLPTVYDAIYRAILSHNMSPSVSQRLIRLLATNIDMKSRITPTDQLEIFYAVPKENSNEKDKKSTQNAQQSQNTQAPPINQEVPINNVDPEIRYISATFGNVTYKYYRYQSKDGSVDYYDSEGKSSKPFLLRKPTPNGTFGSPFGPRKHPILGYVRMHTGVDWIAPKGSPIIAVGDGVVTKVGVTSGYGNHVVIQHANGYASSYSHQNNHAPGLKQGMKVRQGQVIGYVGSTGLATGPHCHFEIIVNGTKVDPMRIRIPNSKELLNQDLQIFLREKRNIDSLINSPTKSINDS
ncbi:M23 family metallopeptidase [Bartonella sp. WD12.1]|uniref:M23 family metallopeptidase n=1 Tax=Bartonella sp. WD12.1 TaxID=1933903 RepID=UPI00099A4922|nr:M23 family metallopeptidase [Bartonella sp. WD12.1]OPB30153.1 Murein DD-endopeptidase MepM and murein hydrolase activator NlpD, containing LysM domain [Bartonella sp. WD12.1]